MNKLTTSLIFGLFLSTLSSLAIASWAGDEITGTVSNSTYAWENNAAKVDFSNVEFSAVLTNVTTTADFTSNTLTLTYQNTSKSPNITYPALSYKFEGLDVGGTGIEGISLVSSTFGAVITPTSTADAIILSVPLKNTDPGDIFTATFEFAYSSLPFVPYLEVISNDETFQFDYGEQDQGTANTGFKIENPDKVLLDIKSAFEPQLGLASGEAVQEGFVLYDGTLFLDVSATSSPGRRANLRTTYRMNIDDRVLRRDFLRARYIRQGVIIDGKRALVAARAGRLSDARLMRYVERTDRANEGRWTRAVLVAGGRQGARADVRFMGRRAPDGVIGHYGTFTKDDSTSYVWAVMDKNSRYAVGINVDNDDDGVFNVNDNCPFKPNTDQTDSNENGLGDVCDTDYDGVIDSLDRCLNTTINAVVDATGCSIEDTCGCDSAWKNHGAYVKCVAHRAEDFVESGLISLETKDSIVSLAGGSQCGKKN